MRFKYSGLVWVAQIVDGQVDVLVCLLSLSWVVLFANKEGLLVRWESDVGDLLHEVW